MSEQLVGYDETRILPTMETYTGRVFNLAEPKAEDVDIVDIATALCRAVRFNGHCSEFYTVAEHSLRVSERVEKQGYPFWGLMHDAAEAYIGDIIAPLKALLGVEMRRIEGRVFKAVYEKYKFHFEAEFPLTGPELKLPDAVRIADIRMLATEAQHLMPSKGSWWTLPHPPYEGGPKPATKGNWIIREMFMQRFQDLTGEAI